MDIIIESLHPTPKACLLSSALAPHLESYCAHFRLGRYAATYSVGCLAGLAHFARWMTLCGLAAEQLDAHKVEQFLNEHLPCCDCPRPVRRNHGALRAALGHMLAVLLEQGVIHAPPAPTGEIADELRRYDDHMNKSRGLSEGTRRGALHTVGQLLLHAFAALVVVCMVAARPFFSGSPGWVRSSACHLTLLIAAQHQRMLGRRHIQAHDVFEFFDELRVSRDLEAANEVRLQAVCLPMPHDRAGTDAQSRTHFACAPVRGGLGRGLRGHLHQLGNVHLHRWSTARQITLNALQAALQIALTPARDLGT